MSANDSKIIKVDDTDWVVIATGLKTGSFLKIGGGTVVITQAEVKPSGDAGTVARMDTLFSEHPKPFFDVPNGAKLWGRTFKGKSSVHVTPGESHA